MGKEWAITVDNIQLAVEAIYQLDLYEEHTSRACRTPEEPDGERSAVERVYAQRGSSNSSDGSSGDHRNRGGYG